MKYTKLIAINSLVIGIGIATVQILDLLTIFYLVPILYAFLLLLNKDLRAKPLALGATVASGWMIALAVLLVYIRLRTCNVGDEDWYCSVEGTYPVVFVLYAFAQTVIVAVIAYISNMFKRPPKTDAQ